MPSGARRSRRCRDPRESASRRARRHGARGRAPSDGASGRASAGLSASAMTRARVAARRAKLATPRPYASPYALFLRRAPTRSATSPAVNRRRHAAGAAGKEAAVKPSEIANSCSKTSKMCVCCTAVWRPSQARNTGPRAWSTRAPAGRDDRCNRRPQRRISACPKSRGSVGNVVDRIMQRTNLK